MKCIDCEAEGGGDNFRTLTNPRTFKEFQVCDECFSKYYRWNNFGSYDKVKIGK
jgi:hypothetical protein